MNAVHVSSGRARVALLAFGVACACLPAVARAQATPTPAPMMAGTPQPTDEPTTPPADALAAAGAVGPEWAAFAKIAESATTFVSTIAAHFTTQDGDSSTTVQITSRKPNLARCEITTGPEAGAVAIWRGGATVQAHAGGDHQDIVVVLPRRNRHVTDALGLACGDTTPDMIVGYSTHNGTLTEAPGPAFDGQATDAVTWIPHPGDMLKVDKIEYDISKVTHLLVDSKIYVGGTAVGDARWTILVDPVVKPDAFEMSP